MIGILCSVTGRHAEALEHFDRALRVNRNQPGILYNRGISQLALGRNSDALENFDRALKLGGADADAYVNRAIALRRLRRIGEAIESCDLALKLNPLSHIAHTNKANALADLDRLEEALASYDDSLRTAMSPDAWMGRGAVLRQLGRYDEALTALLKAQEVEPSHPYLQGEILNLKMQMAKWENFEHDCELLLRSVVEGIRSTHPAYLLSISSTPEQQKRAAETFARDKYVGASVQFPPARPPSKRKIKIGYFSGDFRSHALSYLTAGLFEQHDRHEFEIIGFAYSGRLEDEYTRRIAASMDRFIDVSLMSDGEAASLSRSLGVDIAVDLTGLTLGGRLGIFAHRAAPAQATYLGYIGTLGCSFIDFIIADDIVIPNGDDKYFTERPVRVSVSFQVNDSRRAPVQEPRDRVDYGLPERGFVFCCFNNGYKLTPDAFALWMRLLRRVKDSVLWLVADSETFAGNLRRYAREQGVEADRLVFAERVGPEEYLARQRCADLALDTFYFNGGTTTSDALWTGLPVITRLGATFSGRVGASLLNAIGLPDLVTRTSEEYEELAFRLATETGLLTSVKQRLERNRATTSLFDTELFARRLEAAYRIMLRGESDTATQPHYRRGL
jgi:predicted O-linked N-acetylglucosamine transferase (SPINDLY family)